MPRYIDADGLIKKVFPYDVVDKKCYTINAKMIYEAIQEAPTADVVPRSEVEILKVRLEMAEEAHKGLSELYHTDTDALVEARRKTEVEVAREIFEEIADNLRGLFDFFRQDDCIRESSAIMLSISEIAELKKKYCGEGESAPTKVKSGDICVVCGEPVPEGRQVCGMCEIGTEKLNNNLKTKN